MDSLGERIAGVRCKMSGVKLKIAIVVKQYGLPAVKGLKGRNEGRIRKEHVIPEGLTRPNFRPSKFQ